MDNGQLDSMCYVYFSSENIKKICKDSDFILYPCAKPGKI